MIKRVDENGNVRLITNIRKPRKWRRYEYLLSSGTLGIDLEIPGNIEGNKYKIGIVIEGNSSQTSGIIGTHNTNTPYNRSYIGVATNNNFEFGYGDNYPRDFAYTKGTKYDIEMDSTNNRYIAKINGIIAKDVLFTGNKATSNIYIGWVYQKSANYSFRGKIYYAQVYSNNTLIKDLVPAQYNGLYGMWDLIEDKFYGNSGTGSFTVGPEIKNYDEIYEVRKAYSILPAGVELYDYILSSGTLYIDTGYNVGPANSSNIKLYIDVKATSTGVGNRWWVHGIGGGATCVYAGIGNGSTGTNVPFTYGNGKRDITTSVRGDIGTRYKYTLDLKNKTYNIINASGSSVLSLQGISVEESLYTRPMTIFAWNRATTTTIGSIHSNEVYEYKLWDNDVLVRNMLPCTYLGEPGMWDTVENKFYRNQGTGQFTLGSKITLKEYEYLLSSGTLYINTLYYPNVNTKFIYKVSNPSSGNCYDGEINGSSSIGQNFYIGDVQYAFDVTVFNLSLRKTTPYIALIDESGLYIDNIFITKLNTYESNWISPRMFYLFALNRGSTITYNTNKIYYAQIYNNNQLVRDFIPVSYNGTPGLWDKVEWKFYANAGSGSFTLGPEKASGSIYLHSHLTNLFNGFVGGGQMSLSNGILVGTGNNSDTYFYTKTTQAVNTTSYYLVGLYVEGYTSATAWYFRSPQNNSNATLIITRDGWNWGYVKFVNADSQPIWDDANRAFSGPIPKITISDCRIYKIT